MKYIIFFCLLIIFNGCKDAGLGNNYYHLGYYEGRDIGYPYGTIIYKSNDKNIIGKPFIYSDVVDFVTNKDYILVLQKPNKELFYKIIKDDLEFWKKYHAEAKTDTLLVFPHGTIMLKDLLELMKRNNNQSGNVTDSIFNNQSYYKKLFMYEYNYWIIQKVNDSLIGPLTKEEFLSKSKEMNISERLQLK